VSERTPVLIAGGTVTDDRGTLTFVNGFDLSNCCRSYIVTNHAAGFVRAWHAHRREGKYVTVLRGAAIVGAVLIEDWDHLDPNSKVHRYVLSERSPAVLYIPPGYANGAMSLTSDTMLQYFSTSTLDESKGDDVRIDARFWNPWTVEER
jgi:dTDP-4-dehydrorhamnose 3,5-epimerase-like enzyme